MKRSIFFSLTPLTLAAVIVTAGCDDRLDKAAPAPGSESGWTTTPVIHEAVRTPQGLRIEGLTTPQGRVVLRGGGGPAFATGSDADGRFSLFISRQASDVLFGVETQRGEEAAPAPYSLLVARDPAGPIVMVADGGPSRRLDGDGVLDAIDSDGRALLAGGRAAAGTRLAIRVGDAAAFDAPVDDGGRWSAVLTPEGAGATTVWVGDSRYEYPGPGSAPTGLVPGAAGIRMEQAGAGWRAVWGVGEGGWRSSWYPMR